jgi:hypothetical protein
LVFARRVSTYCSEAIALANVTIDSAPASLTKL